VLWVYLYWEPIKLSVYEINDFLAPRSNVQREGFGSFIDGNYLYHLYHRGTLTGPDYLPSGLLRVEIGTNQWTLTEFNQRIGFPKALAEFSSQGVAVFVDHDKENLSNQSSDGSWLGGYLFKLDLNAVNQGLVPLTNPRLFWHDIKSDGEYRYAFAFDSNKLVAKLDMQGNILSTTRLGRSGGSLEIVGDDLIVAPYGEALSIALVLDKHTLAQTGEIVLPADRGAIHEVIALPNLDASQTVYFFHEDNIRVPTGLGYGKEGVFRTWMPSSVRALIKQDLSGDGLADLIVNTNNGVTTWINDGWGRLIQVQNIFPKNSFNAHTIDNLAIWFDWNRVTMRMNYAEISDIDINKTVVVNELVSQLGIRYAGVDYTSSTEALALLAGEQVHYLDWDGFGDASAITTLVTYSTPGMLDVYTQLENASGTQGQGLFVSAYAWQSDATNYRSQDIDRVLFKDGYVAFDTDGVAGQAYRLYQAAFGQVSDLVSLGNTIYQMDQGLALNAAAGALLGSAEFLNANGSSLSHTDFIALVYGNALGRAPDTGESALWLSRLSSGTAREQLVVALSESSEGSAYVASRIEDGIAYTPYAPAPTYFQTNAGPLAALTYKGPVEFLEFQMLGSSEGDIVMGSDGNDFINLLGGDDAADGGAGRDVLDGGVGSNFLTGGSGADIFFLDGRGGSTTWSTITDFQDEDSVNIWGWQQGSSQLILALDNQGAEGFKGATFHYDLNGDRLIDTSITFSNIVLASLPAPTAEEVAGNGYLLFA
jgi:hypothetical protein